MIILLSKEVFNHLKFGYHERKNLFEILYNENLKFCFSRNYIDLLEASIAHKDIFQAYITELHDSKRIQIVNVNKKQDTDQEFRELAQASDCRDLVALHTSDNDLISKIPFVINIMNTTKVRNRIAVQLLSKNVVSACYQDFKSNDEINNFFQTVFSIQKEVKEVSIFNREQEFALLGHLKGKRIHYFTLLRGLQDYQRKLVKKDLQMQLGNKLKLYWTPDKRQIHERKILYDSVCITVDNALNNICTEEPTWEISITLNNKKSQTWMNKKNRFREVVD